MMKKNKMMRAATGMLIAALLTTSVISGTFAKYTSTASQSDTATVAKWSFEALGTDITVTGNADKVQFGLFDTIKDTNGTDNETDVASTKIAPGTSGSFDMKVKNTSEVTAKYTIVLSENNTSDIPLQYSLDGKNWSDSIETLSQEGLKDQKLAISAAEKTHTIYWRWVYEGTTSGAHASQTDETDTGLGVKAQTTESAPTVTITAKVTATQVD